MIEALLAARRPVALTGAGISAPSGVPTFDVLWKGKPVRDCLGRDFFKRDLIGFLDLLCNMEAWTRARPNAAHEALVRLGMPIITQNIDGLHQAAGASDVIELHGNLRNIVCRACGARKAARDTCGVLRPLLDAGNESAVLAAFTCECGHLLDVDVVLYGDHVRGLEAAIARIEACDLLVVIGSSLSTYPAALLPERARACGARVLIENGDCIAALCGKESG